MIKYPISNYQNSEKPKKQVKCNTFVTIQKILGKTHSPNPYKQWLPEGQGRNDVSPLKGIDTCLQAF